MPQRDKDAMDGFTACLIVEMMHHSRKREACKKGAGMSLHEAVQGEAIHDREATRITNLIVKLNGGPASDMAMKLALSMDTEINGGDQVEA